MAHFVRASDRRQRFLLPVDMMDWLPEDDIVHQIVDAVTLMDRSGGEATCKVGKAGQAPFAPRVLLAVLIYADSHGVRSSRGIERLCGRDAGYRGLVGLVGLVGQSVPDLCPTCARPVPDHTVIARFRQRQAERMRGVFFQVLEMCRAAGLVRLGLVALDGTKVKANASLEANRTASSLDEQIARMMAEAEQTDAREERQFGSQRGDERPKALAGRADRLARLKACKEKLERRAGQAAARQREKIEARAAQEQASGKRTRGRKPKAPDPTVDPDAVAPPTDPDSEIMKTRKGWVQGDNAQVAVTRAQIILAADVTTAANDVHQLTGMLDQAQATVEGVLGEDAVLGAAVADAGYGSAADGRRPMVGGRWSAADGRRPMPPARRKSANG